MRFGCVFARAESGTRWGPFFFRPVFLRARGGSGEEAPGWALLLPRAIPARRVAAAVASLRRRGAELVSVAPSLGGPDSQVAGWGLHVAACLEVALALVREREKICSRALVVGAGTGVGGVALRWLVSKVRYLAVGDAPGRGAVMWERLLREGGVAVAREPVEEPGSWEGDLVVWAAGHALLAREVRAPVWVRLAGVVPQEVRDGSALVVEDALLAGGALTGIPAGWFRAWGLPPGVLPAEGLEAAVWAASGQVPGAALSLRGAERIWQLARKRGFHLLGAMLAGDAKVWLTCPEDPHIIGGAIGSAGHLKVPGAFVYGGGKPLVPPWQGGEETGGRKRDRAVT